MLHPTLHPVLLPTHPPVRGREHSGFCRCQRPYYPNPPSSDCDVQRPARQGWAGRCWLALRGTQLQQQDFRAAVWCRQECVSWKDYLKGTNRSDKLALKETDS